jgi:hypothetical protein
MGKWSIVNDNQVVCAFGGYHLGLGLLMDNTSCLECAPGESGTGEASTLRLEIIH